MKTVVLDVETIADGHAMARCGYQPEEGVFAPWPLHRLACASVLTVGHRNGDFEFSLESFSLGTTNERGIVASVERAIEDADRILTYNGKAFDIPVLLARAIVTGEFVPTLTRLGHRCRPGLHEDLHDEIKALGGSGIKLIHLCAPFGIPAKVGGSGDEVAALAAAGRWGDIEDYCESDVVATWIAAQMWESSEDPGVGLHRWDRIAAWLAAECASNARLAPFIDVQRRRPAPVFNEAIYR
jgi:hypothetical protein